MAARLRSTTALLLAFAGAGCGDRAPAEPAATTAPASTLPGTPYRVVAVEHGGTIAGSCRLVGRPTPAQLRAWPGMGVEAGQSDESLHESAGHALGGCLVAVVGIGAGKDWPVEMRMPERRLALSARVGRFVPHLTWIRPGTQLSVANRLDADLSVHGYLLPGLSNTVFNFAVKPGSEVEPSQAFLEREGVYYVTDDMRHAFTAWVHVLPNPYAESTEAEPRPDRDAGAFRLEDVPAGDYDFVCWHEPADRRERLEGGRFSGYTLGSPVEVRRRVHVAAGATTIVEFAVSLGASDEK